MSSSNKQSETFPTRTFAAGKLIFREGQRSDAAYLIKSGRVEVSRRQGNTKVVLDVLSAPDIFGEMAFINEEPRSASVETLEKTELIVITHEQLDAYLAKSPVIVRALIRCLSARLRNTTATVQQQGEKSNLMSMCYLLSLMQSDPALVQAGTDSPATLNIRLKTATTYVSRSMGVSAQNAEVLVDKLAALQLLTLKKDGDGKIIHVNDKFALLDTAKDILHSEESVAQEESYNSPHEAFLNIIGLSHALECTTADLKEQLANDEIPDSLLYFYKPEFFRWIDSLNEE